MQTNKQTSEKENFNCNKRNQKLLIIKFYLYLTDIYRIKIKIICLAVIVFFMIIIITNYESFSAQRHKTSTHKNERFGK